MVEAEQVKDGRLDVVHLDFVLGDEEAQVVDLADGLAGFDAASGEPHREIVDVMVAADRFAHLPHRGAPELAAPDDQGVIEQAALLEVLDQRGAGTIDR